MPRAREGEGGAPRLGGRRDRAATPPPGGKFITILNMARRSAPSETFGSATRARRLLAAARPPARL
jgi:hypothetical protein